MSSIYIQEPPTEGKVLLVTTAGDLDIELWSKEAPKACRNFVQLCMEGYYNETIFHRVVPGFIVQGGDPTGTGTGGESIYGSPFKDEFHTRLRFVRRGLVAMANAGPNDNGSQFFFTLEATPDLQNKHTIFGKVAGDTVYNLSRFAEGEIGKDGRPEFPHKITKTEILKNPFDDIIPRLAIENEIPKEDSRKKKGTKNFKLLSFGDEAEEDEEEFVTATKKMCNKGNSAHDIAQDPTLSSSIGESKAKREEEIRKIQEKLKKTVKSQEEMEVSEMDKLEAAHVKEKLQKDKSRSEIKAEIRKLKRELNGKDDVDSNLNDASDEEINSKNPKKSEIVEQYYKDKEKYVEEMKKLPKKGSSRESQTMALLQRFSQKIRDAADKVDEESDVVKEKPVNEEDDESWLSHKLNFDDQEDVLAKDASAKDDHWYDLTDPRNAHNKRRREEKNVKRLQ